jgi:hypothetical protein
MEAPEEARALNLRLCGQLESAFVVVASEFDVFIHAGI